MNRKKAYIMSFYKYLLPILYLILLNIPTSQTAKNVHIVINSHLDLTWIMTAQEVYYGEGFLPSYCAKCLFDDLLQILPKSPNRTFTISELFFLLKYYDETKHEDQEKHEKLIDLIKRKQIILGQGGLSIYDEATTHYDDIIDQMSYGMRKVHDLFDIKIEHSWALDVFGQSFTNTFILRKFGVKSLVFDRVSDREKSKRSGNSKQFEFFWGSNSLITHMLPNTYGFDNNAYKERIDLEALIDKASEIYPNQDELMLVFTDDFRRWSDLDYQKFEDHIDFYKTTKNKNINMFFSSPEMYFDKLAQKNSSELKMKDKNDETKEKYTDFFPLVGPNEKPWVGFYTTRPNLKLMIRRFGVLSRGVKNMLVVLKQNGEIFEQNLSKICVEDMEKQIGFLLHHDNSAGTIPLKSEQFVKNVAHRAEKACRMQIQKEPIFSEQIFCNILDNANSCLLDYFSQNPQFEEEFKYGLKKITVTIFNPVQSRKDMIIFRIPDINMKVTKKDGSMFESDTFCETTNELECHLYIQMLFPGYQFQEFILHHENQKPIDRNIVTIDTTTGLTINLDFDFNANLTIDSNFSSFSYNTPELSKQFSLDYKFYESRKASKCPFFDNNGNYIYSCPDESGTYTKQGYAGTYVMRLETGQPIDFKQQMKLSGHYYKTKFFTRVTIHYDNNSIIVKHTFYHDLNKDPQILIMDVNTFINDNLKIDFSIESGREIVMAIKNKELLNKGDFSTDSNGLFPIKRQRWYLDPENPNDAEDLPNNYYPVVSEISINNEKSQMIGEHPFSLLKVFNDRSQGGTSYREGEIEMLITRYINTDDSLGLGQNLTLQEKTYLNHKIVFQDYYNSSKKKEITKISQKNNFAYLVFLQSLDDDRKMKENSMLDITKFASILNEIPDYIKINLLPLDNEDFIIRIQDVYHEESIGVMKKTIEAMKLVCLKDNPNDCISFECKSTLLDGFTEIMINDDQKNLEKDSYDIITLLCKKSQKKDGNEELFKKQKQKLFRKKN